MTGRIRTVAWVVLGAAVGFLLFAVKPVAHALPEYTIRTGEPCATCHVNPAGGGPRTVRGSLWIAAGKPDQVSPLPGSSDQGSAPAAPADGQALYERLGCAGCHGVAGEGGAGPAFGKGELPTNQVTQVIRNGKGAMMAYKSGVLSDVELAAVLRFVQSIGGGEVKAQPKAELRNPRPVNAICSAGQVITPAVPTCGGN